MNRSLFSFAVMAFCAAAVFSAGIPHGAMNIHYQTDTSDYPLSDEGQDVALKWLGYLWQEDIVQVPLCELHQECYDALSPEEKAPCENDINAVCCPERYYPCKEAMNLTEELEEEYLAANANYQELWYGRMGIDSTADPGEGWAVMTEEGSAKYEEYLSWWRSSMGGFVDEDSDDYKPKFAFLLTEEQRIVNEIEEKIYSEYNYDTSQITIEDEKELMAYNYKLECLRYSIEEMKKCGYMIEAQGNDPFGCSAWRMQEKDETPPQQPPAQQNQTSTQPQQPEVECQDHMDCGDDEMCEDGKCVPMGEYCMSAFVVMGMVLLIVCAGKA